MKNFFLAAKEMTKLIHLHIELLVVIKTKRDVT